MIKPVLRKIVNQKLAMRRFHRVVFNLLAYNFLESYKLSAPAMHILKQKLKIKYKYVSSL